ncbi:hypothetical protein PL321_11225 [Caloramator sp. mosi_1]|uniref:hypothetical protein n=1 Tax=Caloramator sp. mosi_1 TaxID=3023090 RepID=UPI00235DE03B|nr:hypothetical protein [Caloramator sp. mosi_1]WDC83337.1 hypothetical protein PL321_11225 [Caloramator sp. mosi_1]
MFQEYIIGPDYSDVALSDDSKRNLTFRQNVENAYHSVIGIHKNMNILLVCKS